MTVESSVLGKQQANYAHEVAMRYREAFPWADVAAVEASMRLNGAFAAQNAALSRFFETEGIERRESRYTILRILYFAHGPKTQNGLRAELGVTSPNVTYLIDGLERDGHVVRTAHPTDRRTTFVELTPQGEELAAKLVPAMVDFMATVCRDFTDEEKQLLNNLLDKFHRNAAESYPKA